MIETPRLVDETTGEILTSIRQVDDILQGREGDQEGFELDDLRMWSAIKNHRTDFFLDLQTAQFESRITSEIKKSQILEINDQQSESEFERVDFADLTDLEYQNLLLNYKMYDFCRTKLMEYGPHADRLPKLSKVREDYYNNLTKIKEENDSLLTQQANNTISKGPTNRFNHINSLICQKIL